MRTDRTAAWEERKGLAEESIPMFEASGDHLGLLYAHRLLGAVLWTHGRSGEAQKEIEQVIEHTRLAGAPGRDFLLHWLAGTLMWGPTPVEEGLRRCGQLLAESEGHRLAEGSILTVKGALLAMAGQTDEARETAARGRAILLDLGGVVPVMAAASRIGVMESVIGDLDRAEAGMRPAVEILARLGDRSYLSTLAPQLGRVLARKGKLADAESFGIMGRDTSPPDDWASQVSWRMALGLVGARRGDFAEAERLLREAVALSEDVDYINQVAEIWFDLAEVLTLAGRRDEAARALQRALALQDAKGNVVGAARTRNLLSEFERR
jgi:tetratricopeptide (TPR) repeat protein